MRRTDLGTRIITSAILDTLYTIFGLILLGLLFGCIGLYAIDYALPVMGYK